ncbi:MULTISPECIES: alpha/beta fold hydrolase [Stenotrophomonas]|jgi:pimeloyl-ACP methyl ester carboxylesterase|uniref:Alpha/beta fold hydrolase n=1 Tax=Stenotrophomonas maltophilia TaxID=40324 RepID=A0A4V3RJT4_STEMA|nr:MULTISPECIES: alpha/beta fold hydrolase [Stenotrophomonas]MBD3826137.1 alpha/beta fold hydrolase [Stenotrophomonas sp.]TGY37170.1 alpha/beta fold hydrolase [Stenotrophomonas maltophilia]HBS63392.1 alpha/beta hydrolase [Stenotrophomonas sp.]
MTPPVLLLHGIWNARAWVGPLAWRLRARGFTVDTFGYASVFGGPDVAVPQLLERLRDSGPVSLVGHSLGGLVALEALRRQPDLPVSRVVCLGSPLRGSGTARSLADHGWSLALGRSSDLLLDGLPAWEGRAQVGLIAGSVPHGLGSLLGAMGEASDGTVALDETQLPGLTDHCVVPASHSGLVFSPDAARQTAAFLRDGRFRHDHAAHAA